MAKDNVDRNFKIYLVSVPTLAAGALLITMAAEEATPDYLETMSNLDSKAITSEEFPVASDFETWGGLRNNLDWDGDGDYDSYIQWNNSDGTKAQIYLTKGNKGEFVFPNLEEKALDPITERMKSENSIVDYKDTNGDGLLESIANYDIMGNVRQFRLVRDGDKYSLEAI